MTTNQTKVLRIICTGAMVAGAIVLAACGNKQPEDTKESLAHDPERLKAVMQDCHNNLQHGNDKLCRLAADANRERFLDRKSVDPDAAQKPKYDPKFASPKF